MLELLIYIGRGLELVFTYVFIQPGLFVARLVFRHVGVPLYRWYFVAKRGVLKIFAPAKSKIFYPLLNKSTIHAALLIIAIAVIAHNFAVKETRAEEFGKQTVLAAMVTGVHEIEIVETAITSTPTAINYHKKIGMLSPADAAPVQSAVNLANVDEEVLTSESSAALVKPALAQTSVDDMARETVEYYTVQPGDTVSTIAEKFNISTNTILWENKLGPRDYIKPGDKLTILPSSGVSYKIQSGDTLDEIAEEYDADVNEIMEFNKLADAAAIETDQILIIPGGIEPAPPAPAPAPSTRSGGSSGLALFNIPAPSSASSSATLLWPTTSRRISQYYKWGHLAIDIAGNYSSPVYAADSGRVEAVGWGTGYGNRIVINHGNGIKTLYAHESKLFVSVGDYVERGQTIGMVGCTGWCTGPHIHFEVIVNGSKQNPLSYL